jgi:GTP-binding protein EngB required for normal cell division
MLQTYNFLIIGRCGSGKSATTRELTGSDNVEVRNSPNSVTRTINFYQSTPAKIERNKVSFSVLDIPGLDKIENRKLIR